MAPSRIPLRLQDAMGQQSKLRRGLERMMKDLMWLKAARAKSVTAVRLPGMRWRGRRPGAAKERAGVKG